MSSRASPIPGTSTAWLTTRPERQGDGSMEFSHRGGSSVGQSSGLIIRRTLVQVQPAPPPPRTVGGLVRWEPPHAGRKLLRVRRVPHLHPIAATAALVEQLEGDARRR